MAGAPPPDYIENGRLYHGYRKGLYMYPCDEVSLRYAAEWAFFAMHYADQLRLQQEKDRMDIYHKFFSVARRGVHHSAQFTPNYDGPRILDLGCGTGIWAIDMAE
jgi:2-polyprenyl-3-methyl-5-hydroxy-6-metoxy-1,4-benzoquinol methylase